MSKTYYNLINLISQILIVKGHANTVKACINKSVGRLRYERSLGLVSVPYSRIKTGPLEREMIPLQKSMIGRLVTGCINGNYNVELIASSKSCKKQISAFLNLCSWAVS